MCYNNSVNIGTSPPDEIMCFDEVRQAERLGRILFYINLENEMAINKTYEELVESAKPKLTTDDCYTPENVYSVVRDYVAERYGLDPETFVRPFYPGGDYQAEAEAEKRRRRGWNSADGVTIELSARERKLCGID